MNPELVKTPIVDKNGVITTRNKKQQSAPTPRGTALPKPAIDHSAPRVSEEQQAVYEELIAAIEGAENNRHKTRRVRIDGLHKYSDEDHTLLFKTFLAVAENKEQLTFMEELHKVLLEAGVEEPHTLVNDETVAISVHIMEDTGNYEIPSRKKEGAAKVRDFIGYALVSGDAELIETIINTHKPNDLEELKDIHGEYKRAAQPLRDGVL